MDYVPIIAEYILLAVLLGIALYLANRVSTDMRPIFVNIVGGVAKQAQSNAMFYAVALMFGLSSSLSAFVDVFKDMDAASLQAMSWHQYAVLWAKVANPFFVTILAYTRDSEKDRKPTGSTTPPFASIPPAT